MSDELNAQKTKLLPAICQASDLPAQAGVCVAAYKVIQETDVAMRASLLSWFIETARPTWIQKQIPHNTATEKLFKLLDQKTEISAEETSELFQKQDGNGDTPASFESRYCVTMDDLSLCINKFKNLITGAMDLLFNEEYTSEVFYTKLWETMNLLLEPCTDIERGVCLQLVLGDSRMPYQLIPQGIRMNEEEFQEITRAISPQLITMSYVLHLPTSQRTESASRILWILEELKGEKQKTVFLSSLMSGIKTE